MATLSLLSLFISSNKATTLLRSLYTSSMQTYTGIPCHWVSRELLQGPGWCDATILPSSRRLTEANLKTQQQVLSPSHFIEKCSHFIHVQNVKNPRIYWRISATMSMFASCHWNVCICWCVCREQRPVQRVWETRSGWTTSTTSSSRRSDSHTSSLLIIQLNPAHTHDISSLSSW